MQSSKYYGPDIIQHFQLRRLASLELAASLANIRGSLSFFEQMDTTELINELADAQTCTTLVDSLTEYYLNELEINLCSEGKFVDDKIAELSYLLSPDPDLEEYFASGSLEKVDVGRSPARATPTERGAATASNL